MLYMQMENLFRKILNMHFERTLSRLAAPNISRISASTLAHLSRRTIPLHSLNRFCCCCTRTVSPVRTLFKLMCAVYVCYGVRITLGYWLSMHCVLGSTHSIILRTQSNFS